MPPLELDTASGLIEPNAPGGGLPNIGTRPQRFATPPLPTSARRADGLRIWASTAPRPFERGERQHFVRPVVDQPASTAPRPFERGESKPSNPQGTTLSGQPCERTPTSHVCRLRRRSSASGTTSLPAGYNVRADTGSPAARNLLMMSKSLDRPLPPSAHKTRHGEPIVT